MAVRVKSWLPRTVAENEGRRRLASLRLKRISGKAQQVIVSVHPEEDDRRADAVRAWGPLVDSSRREQEATLDVPVDQRLQTILSLDLTEDQQAKIQGAPARTEAAPRRGEEAAEALRFRGVRDVRIK